MKLEKGDKEMIGVFDSGIGGVTVLKEILKVLPQQRYIYYSDSIHNPYGDKTDKELYRIVKSIVEYLIDRGCVAVVIACNTASAKCVKRLREEYKTILFIAIEPAYKMVHDYNFEGKTLVLATKGTIESEKFLALYHKYDNHKTILHSCVGLAELIEKNDGKELDVYLKNTLGKYKGVENVVLGCTHYPLIKDKLKKVLGDVQFFDGSVGVAKELKRQLESHKLLKKEDFSLEFIDTSQDKKKEQRFYTLLDQE